jgi:hypothetical protein
MSSIFAVSATMVLLFDVFPGVMGVVVKPALTFTVRAALLQQVACLLPRARLYCCGCPSLHLLPLPLLPLLLPGSPSCLQINLISHTLLRWHLWLHEPVHGMGPHLL